LDISVTLAATDEPGGSGVAEVVFSATGAQSISETHVPGASTEVVFTTEGVSNLSFFAADNAGNIESPKSTSIKGVSALL
jgi:hypothetical protein